MTVNPDGEWLYQYVEASITVAALTDGVALSFGNSANVSGGVWELVCVNVKRTAGAAAATFQPEIREKLDPNDKLTVWLAQSATSTNSRVHARPSAYLLAAATIPPGFYPNPDVIGDTFLCRALWRKRV